MKKEREKSFLAIEFASGAVKLVQIREGENGFQLVKTCSVPISVSDAPKDQEEFFGEAVRKLLSGENLEHQKLILAINNPHTCFSQFAIPKIPKKELAETLKWKMKDELSFPPEEAVIDYRVFEIVGGEKSIQFSALVSALPQNLVDQFQRVLPKEGGFSFTPAYVPFSLSGLPNAFSLSSDELVVVVDIGHSITEIAFYIGGRLNFLRKIAFGGQTLNRALAQPLGSEKGYVSLSQEEAEQAKRQENLFDLTNQNLIARKIEVSKLYPLIRSELEKLCGELKRSFNYYAQEHGASVPHIFLTGGTSHLKGLEKFLEERLEVPIKRIELSKDIQISNEVDSQNLDLYYRLISVVLDRRNVSTSMIVLLKRSAERFVQSLSYTKTAVAVAVVLLVLAGGMSWQYQRALQKTKVVHAQIENLKLGFGESQKIKEIETRIDRGKVLASAILVKEPYWEEVFRELAHAFPKEAILKNVAYDKNSFVISGTIPKVNNQASVSNLLRSIEGPIFRKVILVNSEQNGSLINFTIRCEVG